MKILCILLLIFGCACLNLARGRGVIAKPFTSLLTGALVGGALWMSDIVSVRDAALHAIIAAAGVYFWAVWGWGKYFSALTGIYNPLDKEILWIDAIGDFFFPKIDTKSNLRRGMLQFSLRGLYLIPCFALLGFLYAPAAVFIGLLGALQGPCYSYVRFAKVHPIMLAEVIFGMVIGVMFSLYLIVLGA